MLIRRCLCDDALSFSFSISVVDGIFGMLIVGVLFDFVVLHGALMDAELVDSWFIDGILMNGVLDDAPSTFEMKFSFADSLISCNCENILIRRPVVFFFSFKTVVLSSSFGSFRRVSETDSIFFSRISESELKFWPRDDKMELTFDYASESIVSVLNVSFD